MENNGKEGPSLRDGVLRQIIKNEAWNKFFSIEYTEPDLDIPIKKNYKISICTNCMGYLNFLEKTYIKNIEDNIDYPEIEFVLLNYNSKDGLDDWVRKNLTKYIEMGKLNYYYTTDPVYYSMTHSRNASFLLAQGHIVNNVDADHYINKGFAERINILANNFPHKTVFVKSRQKNRGRLGLYKKEFLELGGYDEGIRDYGFDDSDLLFRASALGYKAVKFTGDFFTLAEEHDRHPVENYENKNWKYKQRMNTLISLLNLLYRRYVANNGKQIGCGTYIKNFEEKIVIE